MKRIKIYAGLLACSFITGLAIGSTLPDGALSALVRFSAGPVFLAA